MKLFNNTSIGGFVLILGMFLASEALGVSCDTDCYRASLFRYPCPIPTNPGRRCTTVNRVKQGLCEAQKVLSCKSLTQDHVATVNFRILGPIRTMAKWPHDKWKSDFDRDLEKFSRAKAAREANERCPNDCIDIGEEERKAIAERQARELEAEIKSGGDERIKEEFNSYCDRELGYIYDFDRGDRSR